MGEARDFTVDLTALVGAAGGINQVLTELDQAKVSDLDCDRGAFGHDRLADTTADFCDRWERGVKHLAEDGKEIADRLTASTNSYRAAEQSAIDVLQRAASTSGGGLPDG